MKQSSIQFLYAGVMTVILPALLVGLLKDGLPFRPIPPDTTPTTSAPETETVPASSPMTIPVLEKDGTVTAMDLDGYLTRVLLGEVPTDFEPEALKAQAVVARTYTLRHLTLSPKHDGGAVCTDYRCCQAYRTEEDYLQKGGDPQGLARVQEAVAATAGKVLTYGGQPAETTYFSCSGGRTEDAAAVWGSEIPYLQAVDSPGEENAEHYSDTVQFSAADLRERLGVSDLTVGAVTYTDGGGVATIRIGGVTFTGVQMRTLLGLRSTAFTVTVSGDTCTFTTRGFGHRVGMSQYGADAMAVGGSTYPEILAHYYPGTELENY